MAADLPDDILDYIYNRIPSDIGEYASVRNVCKGWRTFHSVNEPPPKTPWLLKCENTGANGSINPQQDLHYYTLGTRLTRAILALHEQRQNIKLYYGPGHGYLLVTCPKELLSLFNPLTGSTIPLPQLDEKLWIHSLVCSGSGPTHNWCIVARWMDDKGRSWMGPWVCAVFHPDDNDWMYIVMDTCETRCNVCCFNGLLFGTDGGCATGVYDAISGAKMYEVPAPDDDELDDCLSCHLIESSGKILRVCAYWEEVSDADVGSDSGSEVDSEIKKFEIHQLCSREGDSGREHFWVEITDIGNQILFLDEMNGFSLQAPPGFNGNCIYYMSDDDSAGDDSRPVIRFDIANRREEKLPACPFHPSAWFIPSY